MNMKKTFINTYTEHKILSAGKTGAVEREYSTQDGTLKIQLCDIPSEERNQLLVWLNGTKIHDEYCPAIDEGYYLRTFVDQETGKFFFAIGNIYHTKLCGYDAAAGKLATYCDSLNFSPGFDGSPSFAALQDGTLVLSYEQGREGEQGFYAHRYEIFWDASENWMGFTDLGAGWGPVAEEMQRP